MRHNDADATGIGFPRVRIKAQDIVFPLLPAERDAVSLDYLVHGTHHEAQKVRGIHFR